MPDFRTPRTALADGCRSEREPGHVRPPGRERAALSLLIGQLPVGIDLLLEPLEERAGRGRRVGLALAVERERGDPRALPAPRCLAAQDRRHASSLGAAGPPRRTAQRPRRSLTAWPACSCRLS